ncbi:MAG: hypothetical protein K2X60_06005 [Xanthobacteraceae bacterium]|nr:hypothetical protein [Xanthobacteraceae bacterium]
MRPIAPAESSPRPLYRACRRAGLSPIRRIAGAVLAVAVGAGCGGCSFQLGNLWDKKDAASGDVTGSISPVRVSDDTNLTDSDLALTRNAASDVMTRGGKDISQPWENPQTGARGSVTPLASAYQAPDGRTCRDFLASYVRGANEGWLQGEACKGVEGASWEIRNMKPWRRS